MKKGSFPAPTSIAEAWQPNSKRHLTCTLLRASAAIAIATAAFTPHSLNEGGIPRLPYPDPSGLATTAFAHHILNHSIFE